MAEAKKQPEPSVKKSTGKRVLLISGALILVILAGGLGVGLRWWQDRNSDQTEETPTLPTVVDNLQNLRTDDPDAFDEELQNALDDPDLDNETRALVYIQQGNQAFDNKKYQEAADAYMNAENLVATAETAQLLAVTYQALGENDRAIQYYNLAIERFPSDHPLYRAETDYFREQIINLSKE